MQCPVSWDRAPLVCVRPCFIHFQTIHTGKDRRRRKAHFVLTQPPFPDDCCTLKQVSILQLGCILSVLSLFFSLS